MSMKMSGDTDMDFALMMRHHRQSGVKMAEMELKHGKDAEMKRMAQKIMDSQKRKGRHRVALSDPLAQLTRY